MKIASLDNLVQQVKEHGYIVTYLNDITTLQYEDVDSYEFLSELVTFCESYSLNTLPKLVERNHSITIANLERSLNNVKVVFYQKKNELEKSKVSVKSALVVGKVASAMSRADGKVDKIELDFLHKNIYALEYLNSDEKYLVFIRSVYWSTQIFSQDYLVRSLEKLGSSARKQVLKVSLDVAISDGNINKNEVRFLKSIYRICDIPPKNVLRDLRTRAKELSLSIENKTKAQPSQELIEFDNSLEELLNDFEGF